MAKVTQQVGGWSHDLEQACMTWPKPEEGNGVTKAPTAEGQFEQGWAQYSATRRVGQLWDGEDSPQLVVVPHDKDVKSPFADSFLSFPSCLFLPHRVTAWRVAAKITAVQVKLHARCRCRIRCSPQVRRREGWPVGREWSDVPSVEEPQSGALDTRTHVPGQKLSFIS